MREIFKLAALLGLVGWLLVGPAHGQTLICYKSATGTGCTPVSAAAPLPVTASVSISGFAPATTGTPISVTTGGVTGTLPAGAVVAAFNVGATNTAYCKLGASATTSDIAIPPASWFAFTVGAATQLTCITSTSTTTVNMVGGSGLPTGAGGGGGGSGGGGAITMAPGAVSSGAYSSGSIASGAVASGAYAAGSLAAGAGVDGWDLTQGAKADSACGTATGTCSLIALIKYLNTSVSSAIPAGSAIIGKVGIDQTTPGTTNLVALAANQSVNVAQVNGVTTSTGTGAVGTGTQRIAVGTDTATLAGSTPAATGHGATGSAAPSGAQQVGVTQSGATGGLMKGLISCDSHVFKHITSATDTLAVQGVSSQTIYICGWRARAAGVATWYLENTASTNANCSSTLTQITGVATEAANTGEVAYNPIWGGLKNTSGNGLCINSTGTGGVDIDIWYTQF